MPNELPKIPEDLALAFVATGFAARCLCDELCGGSLCFQGDDPHGLAESAIKVAAAHFLEKPREELVELLQACLAAFDCELLENPDHAE